VFQLFSNDLSLRYKNISVEPYGVITADEGVPAAYSTTGDCLNRINQSFAEKAEVRIHISHEPLTTKTRFQNLQTIAARFISGSSPRLSGHGTFKTLGWLSLQQIRDFNKRVLVKKCINGLAPQHS